MLAEHYVRMCKNMVPVWKPEQEVQVTLAEVADALCCTTRNANLLLKRMEEQGWLGWTPGRGRGNLSRLRLLESPEALVLANCETLAVEGRLQEALERLQDGMISSGGRERFWSLLYQKFGFQQEQGMERMLDVLRFPFYRPLETIHPFYCTRRSENQFVRHAMDGLVVWNVERSGYEGQIAHEWEVDASGTEWTFYLKKGVRFHNGRELVADDVVATFSALIDPEVGSPYRNQFVFLRKITEVGPYTVRFSLQTPHPLFVNLLGQRCATIRPREALQQETWQERLPIGAGPFRFVRNDDEQIVLEAFGAYHKGRPWLDRIEVWVVPDPADRERLHERGEESFYYSNGLKGKKPEHWHHKVQVEPGARMVLWNFNKQGVHQDERFRRAVHLVLDPEAMIRELGGAHAFPAKGLLPPKVDRAWETLRAETVAGAVQKDDILRKEKRLQETPRDESVRAEVHRLLEEVQYKGEPLRVMIYESPENVVDLQWICQRGAAYGLNLVPDIRDRYEFAEPERMEEVDLIFVGLVGEEDEELSLYDTYMTEGNYFRNPLGAFWQKRVDERMEALLRLPSREARLQAFRGMETWLAEEGVVHFLCHTYQTNHFHPNLLGAQMGAQGYVDFRKLWWKS